MSGEAREIFWGQPILVAHLDAIRPTLGQVTEESVEIGDEISTSFVVGRMKAREFKNADSDLRPDGFARFQERAGEQIRIKEVLVPLPCPDAEPGQVGKFLHRDLVSDLKPN